MDETIFEKYENMMHSRVGRSRRTIDLSRERHVSSYHDISDTVEFDPA